MISSCCAAFVAPFASRACRWRAGAMLRIFTAMAFPSLVAFVRNWFPRNAYGRVWGFLNSGFQSGYFLASLGYGPLVARGALGWRTPFEVVAALGAAHCLRCVGLLQNKPRPLAPPPPPAAPPPPGAERAERAEQKVKAADDDARAAAQGDGGEAGARSRRRAGWRPARRGAERRARTAERRARSAARAAGAAHAAAAEARQAIAPEVGLELHSPARTRPCRSAAAKGGAVDRAGGGRGTAELCGAAASVCEPLAIWAMIAACACYSPIVEFGTYLSSYLKEIEGAKAFPACIASAGCERRYRIYVASYVTSLLAGSFIYDRCSQLDKALLVVLCYCINIGCWGTLALAEAPAPPRSASRRQHRAGTLAPEWAAPLLQAVREGLPAAALGQVARGGGRLRLDCDPVVAPVCNVRDGLWEGGRRDAVVDPVGGRLWREPPLPPPLPAAAEAARMARRLRYPRRARPSRRPSQCRRSCSPTTRSSHAGTSSPPPPQRDRRHPPRLREMHLRADVPGARRTYSYAAAKRNYCRCGRTRRRAAATCAAAARSSSARWARPSRSSR